MEKLLFSLGFVKTRQKGSHVFYRHINGRTTTIPHHKGRILSRPLIREILKDIEITPNEYTIYLEKL
ncbi:MAG TPA: type II toxin-antitoxin system HicA family toxin [Thermodesulfobacteriota bacterium]|nr:type II toxin-antitoxin system HicA family toxin [Thermodesulfobacteriota bacterium]